MPGWWTVTGRPAGSSTAARRGPGGRIARSLLDLLDRDDPVLVGDRARLEAVRAARAAAAQGYFAAHARQWDEIRRLHVPEAAVGTVRRAFAGMPVRALLDLGTGTGRMLELFAPDIERGMGVDLSPDMLGVARANLERAGVRNCPAAPERHLCRPGPARRVRRRDRPSGAALSRRRQPRVKAARVLAPGGRLLVVDFAPHGLEFLREAHAHRHLGFDRATVEGWLAAAGLELVSFDTLTPDGGAGDGLTVSL